MEKKLRLKRDPQRVGVWSGKDEDTRERNGKIFYLVRFPNGNNWHPESELEEVTEDTPTDPADLFRSGNLSGAHDLRRAVTHVRLSGKLTDMIYSMDATNTNFYAYQFKPVVKLLHSPLNGILVADEVGLGKTIEAGIIWKELEARFDYRRLLVVCPASLREKWRDELKNKIGVSAQFADAATVLENVEKDDDFALICSHQGIRLPAAEGKSVKHKLARFLQDREGGEPVIDLLVIDEAHHMRNLHTQTRKTGRLLRMASHHVVLLTATPLHNKNEDLFSLLNLLTTDSDERPADFEGILQANRPLVELRNRVKTAHAADVRRGINEAMQNPLLSESRQLKRLLDTLPTDGDFADTAARARVMHRLETANLLGHCLTRTLKRDVQDDFKVVRVPSDHPVTMGENESAFYKQISEVVADYFGESREMSPADVLAMGVPHRMVSSCMTAAYRRWAREDLGGEDDENDYWDEDEESPARAVNHIGALTRELCVHCQKHIPAGFDQTLAREDGKYAKLRDTLRNYFDDDAPKKAVLFSEFKGTLAYLEERLADDGVRGIVLKGGLTTGEKTDIVREFRDNPEVRVLLSSEVGGEGIDLQFAQLLINYDIPWNPMRLEQRIGRLDRLGQTHERIFIWNLYHQGTINERIYELLQGRLQLCRRAFGGMEPVLAEKVKELTAALLRRGLTEEEKAKQVERAAMALEANRVQTEELEKNAAHFVGLGDYILNQINEARDLNRRIGGEELRRYFGDFLRARYPGSELREIKGGVLSLSLSEKAFVDLRHFIEKVKPPEKTAFARDMRGQIIFVDAAATKRGNAEPVSQYHPLIRFTAHTNENITPAVAVKIKAAGGLPPGVYLAAGELWSYRGAAQVSEKMAYAGKVLNGAALSGEEAERLVNHAINDGEHWIGYRSRLNCESAGKEVDDLFFSLSGEFDDFVGGLREEDNDRSAVQEKQIEIHRDDRLAFFNARMEKLRRDGNDRMLPAEEGRKKKFAERINARLVGIRKKREMAKSESRHIFAAAVLVE